MNQSRFTPKRPLREETVDKVSEEKSKVTKSTINNGTLRPLPRSLSKNYSPSLKFPSTSVTKKGASQEITVRRCPQCGKILKDESAKLCESCLERLNDPSKIHIPQKTIKKETSSKKDKSLSKKKDNNQTKEKKDYKEKTIIGMIENSPPLKIALGIVVFLIVGYVIYQVVDLISEFAAFY